MKKSLFIIIIFFILVFLAQNSLNIFSLSLSLRQTKSTLMAKPKAPRRTLDSYTVKHINKTVKGNKIFPRNKHIL